MQKTVSNFTTQQSKHVVDRELPAADNKPEEVSVNVSEGPHVDNEDDAPVMVVLTPPAQPLQGGSFLPELTLPAAEGDAENSGSKIATTRVIDRLRRAARMGEGLSQNPNDGSDYEGDQDGSYEEGINVDRDSDELLRPDTPPPTGWMEWSWVEVSRGDIWGASGGGVGVPTGLAPGSVRFGPVGRVPGSATSRNFDVISLPSDRATTPMSGIGTEDEIAAIALDGDGPTQRSPPGEDIMDSNLSESTAPTSSSISPVTSHPSSSRSPVTSSRDPLMNSVPVPLQQRPLPQSAPHHPSTQSNQISQPPPILSVRPQKTFSPPPVYPLSITPPPRSTTPTHIAASVLARMELVAVSAAVAAQNPNNSTVVLGSVPLQRGGSDSGTGSGPEGGFGAKRRTGAAAGLRGARKRRNIASGGALGDDSKAGGNGKKDRSIWRVWWDGVTVWGVEVVRGDGDWQWTVIKIFGAVVAAGVGGYVLIRLGSNCQKRLAYMFGSTGAGVHERF